VVVVLATRVAEAALTPFACGERLGAEEAGGLHGDDHELRDPVSAVHRVGLARIGVDEYDPYLSAVTGVDEPWGVEARDAVPDGKPAAGEHQTGVPLGDGDRVAGRNERPAAGRLEEDVTSGDEIRPRVAGVRVGGRDCP